MSLTNTQSRCDKQNITRYASYKIDKSNFDPMTGFLEVDATIARVGVQAYMTADGVRRELRPEDAVASSAITFKSKPLTLNHPSDGAVTADNFSKVVVGFVPDIEYKDGLLSTLSPLIIQDAKAIQAASTSHQQLSAGYLVDLVDESGVWVDVHGVQGDKGKKYEYDAIQTNIRANHVALVEEGRAGKIASLKFDGTDDNMYRELLRNDAGYEINSEIEPISKTVNPNIDNIMTINITIDGKEYNETQVVDLFHTVKSDHQAALTKLQTDLDSEKQRADVAEGKLLAAEKLNKEQEATITSLKSDEDIEKEISARMDAWLTALPILGVEKADYKLSVAEVNKLVVKKLAPEMNLDDMSDSVIQGVYLGLTANLPKVTEDSKDSTVSSSDPTDALKTLLNRTAPKPSHANKVDEAIKSYEQQLADAWKSNVSTH